MLELLLMHSNGWTFYPSVRRVDDSWEGVVRSVGGTPTTVTEHVCRSIHDDPADAFTDAIIRAMSLRDVVSKCSTTRLDWNG
ncbi:hypothetical protein [Variovorax atrisoli]|uniref:hypothetical protein n=1 Tax=Variovorax atrisoli TaxID=3394203 RepID=UPI001ABFAFC8|nr:hypothetical protein [Variovorax paradoxus]